MERVNLILRHPQFVEALRRNEELERGRVYCGHGMGHILDTARIAYVLSLENDQNSGIDKELIYAAALLHDIGRARQYEDGTPHEIESAAIAEKVLPECGFNGQKTELIIDAILSHRTRGDGGDKKGVAGVLYRADKLSRRCFDCGARGDCDWELKNARLEY